MVVSVRFLHCKVTIFPFSFSVHEKPVTESSLSSKGEELISHPGKKESSKEFVDIC